MAFERYVRASVAVRCDVVTVQLSISGGDEALRIGAVVPYAARALGLNLAAVTY